MADEQLVGGLKKMVESLLEYDKNSLVSRPRWGDISFELASKDLNLLFDLANHLQVLPLEYLIDDVARNTQTSLKNAVDTVDKIDKFALDQGNPIQIRNQLITEVHSRAEDLYRNVAMWVPFLAYQKGDVTKNIEALTKTLADARGMIENTRSTVEKKSRDIDSIIAAAREASAAAGAAVFTSDFNKVSGDRKSDGDSWLKATVAMAALTLVVAISMWIWPNRAENELQLVQKMGTKFVILGVLISGTFWCGKIFKALMHQSAVYRHKALSIQTLQAFSAGASDPVTKDAVLLEAARAVFGNVPTGYLDSQSSGSDSDIKIVEVAKSFTSRGNDK